MGNCTFSSLRNILLFSFFALLSFTGAYAQADTPCEAAQRWDDGSTWNANGTINDASNAPAPNGIVACGSSANTQSQVAPFNNSVYHSSAFNIDVTGLDCIDPSSGLVVNPINPTEDEPIIWLNFDVRANGGSFEVQINDNSGDNVAWALYSSNSPTNSTSTGSSGDPLSGDCGQLTLRACGVESSSTWNTLPVPDFNSTTNYYIAIWDQDADGDVQVNNFKARFGCGDSGVLICNLDEGTPTAECNTDGTYTVSVPVSGINGEFYAYDPNATPSLSSTSVCLTNPGTTDVTSGTLQLTYLQGTDYNITIFEATSSSPPVSVPDGACPDPDGTLGGADACTASVSGTAPICFTCPTLSNETPDIATCEGDQTQTLSVTTDVNDINFKFVYFSSAQTDPYGGGTQLGSSVSPSVGIATSSADISGLAPGSYYAYAILDTADADLTDPNCRPFAEIEITITPKPDVPMVTATQPTCELITGTLEVTAPLGATLEYSIDGTTFQAGTTFAGLAAGVYNITVRDTGDTTCSNVSADITIDAVPNAPTAGPDATTSVCESMIVDLSSLVTVNGGTFTTNGGGILDGSNFDTTGLTPGEYTVIYTVESGICRDEAIITISVAEDIILQTCEASPATYCGDGTTKYDFYWFGSNQSSGGSNFFGSNTSNLTFTEFNDGSALIEGTTVLGSCKATLYIKLDGKKNWTDWQAIEGGTFKNMGCTNPNPANLEYYVIDNTVSTITTNGGDCLEEGTFIVSQKPDPNDPLTPHLGVIVGPGGVLHGLDANVDGIAGWGFMGTEANPKKYEIDFNFELNCSDATGCDLEMSCDKLVPDAGVSASYTACEDEAITMNGLYELLGNTAEFGGTWSPVTFNGPGDYTYTHTAIGTCPKKSATVTVEVQGKLSAGSDGTITVCESDILTNKDLFALLKGADEGGTWSDPINGIYTYTVGGSGQCSEDTATVTVTYVERPNAGIDSEITSCGDSESPSDDILFSMLGGDPDKGGAWDKTKDYFEYTVQGEGSCVDVAYVVIHKEKAPSAGEDGALEVCEGTQPTEAELFAALTNADLGGTWSEPVSGVYTYTVITECGTDMAIVSVSETTSPSAGEDVALTVCEGKTLTDTDLFEKLVGAAAGGIWSGPDAGGVYTYTLAAAGTCPADSATVTVTINNTTADAGDDVTICSGDTATLTAVGVGSYLWSTGEITQSIVVEPTNTVAYTVTVTNENCTDADEVMVIVNDEGPSAGEDGTLTVCEGTTPTEAELIAALSAADLGGIWSGPDTAGVYTYTVITECGTDMATVSVTETTSPSAGEDGALTVCAGTKPNAAELFAALTAADSGGTWSGPVSGVHTYTVTADCGTDMATVSVTETTSPSAGEDGALTVCIGTIPTQDELFAALFAADSGGTWSGPVSGVHTYTVTADCGNDMAIVSVTETMLPNAGDDNSLTVCEGISVDLTTLVSEAGGTFENTSGFGSLTDAAFDTTGLEPGNYMITYTVTNDCGEENAHITVAVDEVLNCNGPITGCQTSYARYADSNSCFIDDNLGPNRWGWTNYFEMEGVFVMDLYAGAGGCSLTSGEKSGNVYVDYSDGKVTVRAEMLDGFVMTKAHMFIGDEPYPLKNGEPTIANGQLGNISEELDNETTYVFGPFDVSNYVDGVHIIFHADTCKKGETAKVSKTRVTPYPMTFKNDLNLNVEISYDAQLDVEIFDVNGRCILTKKGMTVKAGLNNVHMNVSSLAPNMYILMINTGREKIIKKVLSIK